VSKTTKRLLIGSAEAYSGKSAAVLGMGLQLIEHGIDIGYGKPLEGSGEVLDDAVDDDVRFISSTLKLAESHTCPTVLTLDESAAQRYMSGQDTVSYSDRLRQNVEAVAGDLVLLEGPGTLAEGRLFGLSLLDCAELLDAQTLLVARYHGAFVVDSILDAKRQLGDRLLGVLINDIPADDLETVKTTLCPFLEQQQIPVLGTLPRNNILRSVRVGELVNQLKADVLCCSNRMDLMVETLKIGAMNVNSALKFFRKAHNMAVVTGGDRTDLQLAALETSTHCLVLTGQLPPMDAVRQRAEDLEIPILSVDLDTLTTVEIIERAFEQVRLHEAIKVECVQQLMTENFNLSRLLDSLGLAPPVPA